MVHIQSTTPHRGTRPYAQKVYTYIRSSDLPNSPLQKTVLKSMSSSHMRYVQAVQNYYNIILEVFFLRALNLFLALSGGFSMGFSVCSDE